MDGTAIRLQREDRMYQFPKTKIKKSKQVVDVLDQRKPNQLLKIKTLQATITSRLMHIKHANLQFWSETSRMLKSTKNFLLIEKEVDCKLR